MDTATAEAFRAMRRLEFGLAFPRAVAYPFGAPGPLSTVLAWVMAVVYVVVFTATCAVFRGVDLAWQRHLPLPWLLGAGALWGLAGLIPLAGALLAGAGISAVTKYTQYQPQLHLKPLADLLPLTERQALTARAQGRALAFGVYLLAGVLLGLLTRQLMLTCGLVRHAPGLLDPWPVAAIEVFAFATVGGTYYRLATRRLGVGGAMALVAAYWVPIYVFVFIGRVHELFVYGQWNIVLGATLILVYVTGTSLVAHLVYLDWERRASQREPRPAPVKAEAALKRRLDVQGSASLIEFETATAAEVPRLLRRAAVACGKLALGMTVVLIVIQATILLCGVVYTVVHGLSELPPEIRDSPTMVLGFALLMTAAAVGIIVPLAAWGERMVGTSSFARHMQRPGVVGPHLSALLPIAPRQRWWRRLAWVVTQGVVVAVGGLAACAVVCWADQALPFAQDLPAPAHCLGARLLLPVGMVLAASLIVFAYGALLGQTNRVFQLGGCLLMFLFYVGMFGGVGLTVAHDHNPSPLLPVIALIWMGLALVVSRAGMEPSFWPRRPDGGRSLRATVQAVAIVLSVPVTLGLGIRLLMGLTMGGSD